MTQDAPKVTQSVTLANADNATNDSERRHDPLCHGGDLAWTECATCDLIACVREDERERAKKIVGHFDIYSGDRDDIRAWIAGTPPKWWETGMP